MDGSPSLWLSLEASGGPLPWRLTVPGWVLIRTRRRLEHGRGTRVPGEGGLGASLVNPAENIPEVENTRIEGKGRDIMNSNVVSVLRTSAGYISATRHDNVRSSTRIPDPEDADSIFAITPIFHRVNELPDKATSLAQSNLEGSGDSERRNRPSPAQHPILCVP